MKFFRLAMSDFNMSKFTRGEVIFFSLTINILLVQQHPSSPLLGHLEILLSLGFTMPTTIFNSEAVYLSKNIFNECDNGPFYKIWYRWLEAGLVANSQYF